MADPIVGLRKALPRHGFTTTRDLLKAVGGKGFGSIGTGDGLTISVRAGVRNSEIDAAASVSGIRAALRRLMKSRGALTVKRIQDAVRRLDAYKTGLFLSSFRAVISDDDGAPLRLSITNDAPYALYVHPKGTARNQTIVRKVMPGILSEAKRETIVEVKALMRSPAMQRLVKRYVAAGAR